MSLIVPKAGTDPGRAANMPLAPAPQGFDMAAQVAGAGAQLAIGLENDRLERERNRLGVDLQRDLNNLRLQTESIGDPDQLEASWSQGVAALHQHYFEAVGENGQPILSPRNREDFGLAFDELANRHAFAIGARALDARNSEREATWLAWQQQAGLTAGANADPEMRGTLAAEGAAQLASMVAAGIISPEEAERRRQALGDDLATAAAIGQMDADPEAFLRAADAGQYDGLGGETLARYRTSAAAAIARRDQAAASAAAAATADRLKAIRDIAAAGHHSSDEAFLDTPEARASPDYPRTRAARDLRDEMPDLALMPPEQLRTIADAESARNLDEPYQAARAEALQAAAAAAEQGWSADPIGYAMELGAEAQAQGRPPPIDVPALPDDLTDTAALTEALQSRAGLSRRLQIDHYTDAPHLLTNDERARIVAASGPENDPAARLALARAMPALIGGGADDPAQLSLDPVFYHMAGLVDLGRGSVAPEVFRGQQVLAAGNVTMPPDRDRLISASAGLSDVFADVPGGEQTQARVRAAADALYAARIRPTPEGAEGEIDTELYRQALHEVMGGRGPYGSTMATGGVQDVQGAPTILPPGIRADQVNDLFWASGLRGILGGEGPLLQMASDPAQQAALADLLARSSTGGHAPAIASAPGFERSLRNVRLLATGPGQYVLYEERQSGRQQWRDTEGRPYTFDLATLLRLMHDRQQAAEARSAERRRQGEAFLHEVPSVFGDAIR